MIRSDILQLLYWRRCAAYYVEIFLWKEVTITSFSVMIVIITVVFNGIFILFFGKPQNSNIYLKFLGIKHML